jgi:predicted RNase H-like nuclease (RuvC/YqgF family)
VKLPWNKASRLRERVEELEEQKASLEDELESVESQLEAEAERRKRLARQKQEAEEKLNRLQDRLEAEKSGGEPDEVPEADTASSKSTSDLSHTEAMNLLERLDRMSGEGLVQVCAQGRVSKLEDVKGLRDELGEKYGSVSGLESVALFHDPQLFTVALDTRPFIQPGWRRNRFDTSDIQGFVDSKKTWVLASAGDTTILEEESGRILSSERVSSRVDRDHSKGGFSQERFEEKRDNQIERHLKQVKKAVEGCQSVYLLGEEQLCSELPGERLGGFDPNASPPEQLYAFRVTRL